jgi:transcriptional regulator with XRE-family HTH domain
MGFKWQIKKENVVLGKNIERLRMAMNISCAQLGLVINQNKQQVLRYESGGDLVPLPVLEFIARELEQPIGKKMIRKICLVRKLEIENETSMADELIELYNQILQEDPSG